jgi:hypothetical protein
MNASSFFVIATVCFLVGCGVRTPGQQTQHDDARYGSALLPYLCDIETCVGRAGVEEYFRARSISNGREDDDYAYRFAGRPRPRESVRTELVRLQQQTGLSLASLGFGLQIVLFDERTLFQIPISRRLGLVRGTISLDGTEIIVTYTLTRRILLNFFELMAAKYEIYRSPVPERRRATSNLSAGLMTNPN